LETRPISNFRFLILDCQRKKPRCSYDQIDLKMNQLCRKLSQLLRLLLGKSVLDGEIFALNPPKLAQLLPKRVHEDRHTRSIAIIQETYAEDFRCLLRVR